MGALASIRALERRRATVRVAAGSEVAAADQARHPLPGRIPFSVRVGVTGHRNFGEDQLPALRARIDVALERIRSLFPATSDTPVILSAVSSLAEGADRMAAEAVLAQPGGQLEVVLPMHLDTYLEDFTTEKSRAEFHDMLARACRVVSAPEVRPEERSHPEHRGRQYEWASHFVVERSDVLVALWDGEPSRGRGGTASAIRFALERSVPVLWIPVGGGPLVEDLGEGSIEAAFVPTGATARRHRQAKSPPIEETKDALRDLDTYNRMPPKLLAWVGPLSPDRFAQELRTEDLYLPASPAVDLARLADWIRPYYTWADRRAVVFRRWYTFGVLTIFAAAAAAVLAAALEAVFDLGWFIAVETALLCSIGVVVYLGRRFELHDQWINSRFLAERFRSSVFLKAAGISRSHGDLAGQVIPGQVTDWIRRAYEQVWWSGPEEAQAPLEEVRALLADGWIQPQVDYHAAKGRANTSRDSMLLVLSMSLFAVTVVLALVHLANWLHGFAPKQVASTLSLLATSLPAFGAAVAGISAHMQYRRHGAVYKGMARQLEVVRHRILRAPTYAAVRAGAADADEVMAVEQRDWHGVMRFSDLDVG